ncbi:MAG: uridine kinase [Oscillospiraceae bacterium]
MRFINTNNINSLIDDNIIEFIKSSEEEYRVQIMQVAESIAKHSTEKPVVLISGPSGSGKTTTAYRLKKILNEVFKCKSHVISLDNYFKSNSSPDMPKNTDGSLDLESPYCIDIELLKEHIQNIYNGMSFQMPYFNFVNQERGGYREYTVNKGEITIFEGIHALNPMVTGIQSTNTIYVSVRTRLVNDDGSVLHPRRIRLMRRLCRDSKFRGKNYQDTFKYFNNVSIGENNFIMPFKHLAEFDIDTFHAYEPSVYKNFLLDGLITLQDELNSNVEYCEIVSFLSELNSVNDTLVPNTSIVREFIGGSEFDY